MWVCGGVFGFLKCKCQCLVMRVYRWFGCGHVGVWECVHTHK